MNAFCPVCGTSSPVTDAKVRCSACGTVFDAPRPAQPDRPGQPVPPAPAIFQAPRPASPAPVRAGGGSEWNPLAIVSLVTGILCCVPLAPIAAVVTGIIALNQLKQNPQQKGRDLAIAGLILGGISFGLMLIGLFLNLLGAAAR